MKVGTAITASYIARARKCLLTLPSCGADPFVVTYGFHAPAALRAKCPGLTWYHLPAGQPGDCGGCVQYGAWTRAVPFAEDELVVLVDADSMFQRPIGDDEVEILQSIGRQQAGMNYNAGPDDTLRQEVARLAGIYADEPPDAEAILEFFYPGYGELPCYNGGFIAARMSAWYDLRDAFEIAWPCYTSLFRGINACQVLTNWLLQRGIPGSSVLVVPQTIHTHSHYPLPPDCRYEVDPQAVYCGDRLVWFAHHFGCSPAKRFRQ